MVRRVRDRKGRWRQEEAKEEEEGEGGDWTRE